MDGGAGLRKRNKGGASTFESTAQDDVVERVARHVRHLDVYSNNKLSPEFKVQTEMGGQISLVGWVVTLVLFLGELSTYLTVSTHEHMVVDTTLGHKLRIDMNVTFPAITCAEVHLDAMDVAGDFHPYMEQVRRGAARARDRATGRAKRALAGGRRGRWEGRGAAVIAVSRARSQHLKKQRIDSNGKPVSKAVIEEANVVEQAKADVPAPTRTTAARASARRPTRPAATRAPRSSPRTRSAAGAFPRCSDRPSSACANATIPCSPCRRARAATSRAGSK